MNEEEKQTQSMREYLRIKKINENDKSDEMVEQVYEEVVNKEENER